MDLEPSLRRATVVGCGLIGGSIGLGLRDRGWHVSGIDADDAVAARAVELGALDVVGIDPLATITFVATPVGAIPAIVRVALESTTGAVTDVGGAKTSIVDAVSDPRFVGGHPMAGSEQLGVDGASADLFEGAVWVLTPNATTDPAAYALVRTVVSDLGAEVVALDPARHDEVVAVVSHVPHLTASALMSLASGRAEGQRTLLRLAAGGFRDMTRVSAGSPGIWPDICAENREAIVAVLDELIGSLGQLRTVVADDDRAGLLERLEAAQSARINLPSRVSQLGAVVELRIPIPDTPGVIAQITTLGTELGVNVADVQTAHSSEGDQGVLLLLVEADKGEAYRDALVALGYRPSLQALG
jgi:prephenate dehydrogenase